MNVQRFDSIGFRRRLVSIVRASGLTNTVLADQCNIKLPTLEMYLYSDAMPGARSLFNIAQGLDVSVDWLLFGGRDVRRMK